MEFIAAGLIGIIGSELVYLEQKKEVRFQTSSDSANDLQNS